MLPLSNTGQDTRCPGYCDCSFPNCIDLTNYKGYIPDLVKCHCGEDNRKDLQWGWHSAEESDALIVGRDIIFHPTFSQGTAIVRGEQPLEHDKVHFWEMRVITSLAGTDVMFGIGTDSVNLEQFKFHFVSALGTDAQSWGYSYNGKIQHSGDQLPYGQKFSQGCLVGIYLDRTRGHLEYFLNRRSLGVAYKNIPTDPHVKIYPMACSTAAKSVIRLVNCTSQPVTLQFRALESVAKQPQKLAELRKMPGLKKILDAYWFLAPPSRYSRCSSDRELDLADEAVLSNSKLRKGRKQKYREVVDVNIVDDLYLNAHKIPVRHSESDGHTCHSTLQFCDERLHYLF